MGHLDRNNILVYYQHDFRAGNPRESQLFNAIDNIVRSLTVRRVAEVFRSVFVLTGIFIKEGY